MDWYQPASPDHQRKERAKAKELRQSMWWKNQLGRRLCYYCEQSFHPSELTMDHKIPIVRGGRTTRANVVVACKSCNSSKQSMTPFEWK